MNKLPFLNYMIESLKPLYKSEIVKLFDVLSGTDVERLNTKNMKKSKFKKSFTGRLNTARKSR